jgi:hypothetical protein
MARKPTAIVTLSLRIREELRRNLEQAAKTHQRSMNIEIVKRLEETFLKENLAALMREHIELAATAAAEKVVQKLRDEKGPAS